MSGSSEINNYSPFLDPLFLPTVPEFAPSLNGSMRGSNKISNDGSFLASSTWDVDYGLILKDEFVDKCFLDPPLLPPVPGSAPSMNSGTSGGSNITNDGPFPASSNCDAGLNLEDDFVDKCFVDHPMRPPPDPRTSNFDLRTNSVVESCEDCDFSDVVLKYINRMLMEEDIEEKNCMFQESSTALQAAEKSFYDVIGKKYPPSPNPQHNSFHQNFHSSEENYSGSCNVPNCGMDCNCGENESIPPYAGSSQSSSRSSLSSCSSNHVADGFVESPLSSLTLLDNVSENERTSQLRRGVEEVNNSHSNDSDLPPNLKSYGLLIKEPREEPKNIIIEAGKHETNRGRKNPHPEVVDLESERGTKVSAVYTESTVRSAMFDWVLLCNEGKGESELRESLKNETRRNVEQIGQSKGKRNNNSGKRRIQKQKGKRNNMVDLRTLLTLCAQAVVANDQRNANDLLKQIRQHSNPTGDGMQRLAIYFADALEARLAGSGTHIYKGLFARPTSAADILKAYHLYLAVCPFKKLSNFFSNTTIMKVAEKAMKLHIVDIGISYGFQWPSLIQKLASRLGAPPKLRITGIDNPRPGFKPAERIEETGRRLANYAESFNVPFEFNAIAQKWETIQLEDIKMERDEVLVVNCLFRLRNLLDETVVLESPRDIVLNLIRKMNPDVFIQGTVNGAYSAPFFMTRFREAIYHYSALFDMLEATVPREIPERLLLEKEIFGKEAMNVIACEGSERIERPEPYKQWQVRNLRAGFRQLPLNEEIMRAARERLRSCYHKDFVLNEDGKWLLLGWKGRIVHALSTWKPAD